MTRYLVRVVAKDYVDIEVESDDAWEAKELGMEKALDKLPNTNYDEIDVWDIEEVTDED